MVKGSLATDRITFQLFRLSYSSCRHCFSPSGCSISWAHCVVFDSQQKCFFFHRYKAKMTWGGKLSAERMRQICWSHAQTRTMCQEGCLCFFALILTGTLFLKIWRNKNDWHGIWSTWRSHSLTVYFVWIEGPVWKIYGLLRDCNAAFVALVPQIPVSLRFFSSQQLCQRRIAKSTFWVAVRICWAWSLCGTAVNHPACEVICRSYRISHGG